MFMQCRDTISAGKHGVSTKMTLETTCNAVISTGFLNLVSGVRIPSGAPQFTRGYAVLHTPVLLDVHHVFTKLFTKQCFTNLSVSKIPAPKIADKPFSHGANMHQTTPKRKYIPFTRGNVRIKIGSERSNRV